MRSVIVIFLLGVITQSHAKDSKHELLNKVLMDKVANKLVDKLSGRALKMKPSLPCFRSPFQTQHFPSPIQQSRLPVLHSRSTGPRSSLISRAAAEEYQGGDGQSELKEKQEALERSVAELAAVAAAANMKASWGIMFLMGMCLNAANCELAIPFWYGMLALTIVATQLSHQTIETGKTFRANWHSTAVGGLTPEQYTLQNIAWWTGVLQMITPQVGRTIWGYVSQANQETLASLIAYFKIQKANRIIQREAKEAAPDRGIAMSVQSTVAAAKALALGSVAGPFWCSPEASLESAEEKVRAAAKAMAAIRGHPVALPKSITRLTN